jgi:hypothetical protein
MILGRDVCGEGAEYVSAKVRAEQPGRASSRPVECYPSNPDATSQALAQVCFEVPIQRHVTAGLYTG